MKYSCDLVKDLLPLYHDEVCSESSKQIVEAHLAECDSCKNVMAKIKDSTYENDLRYEKLNIVGHYTEKVKRMSLVMGIAFSAIFAVPILVCLIVNLATGHALDWFFIVLTSMMVLASITVVPLIMKSKKGFWTIVTFTASLMLLLMTCCLYTGGKWFFLAAIPVLFGLSVIFLPYVLSQLPIKGFWSKHKGLLAMITDTLLLYAIIIVSATHYLSMGLLTASVNLLFPWGLFLIIRYLKTNGFIRAGLCTILGGIYASMANNINTFIADGVIYESLSQANLFVWNYATIDANISLLILITSVIAGLGLLIAGIIRKA
jgi:Predicted integral membrane protein